MSYSDKHELRDGRIVLYRRNGRPVYHARFNLDGVKGYIVKTTKRKSLAEAVRFAEDLYDDLRYKVRQGLEVRPHTFETLWRRWLRFHQNTLSTHRIRYISGTANRYFLSYFGEMSLEEISERTVESYWTWRLNYWSSDQGQEKIANAQKSRTTEKRPYKQKLGNVAKIPAQKTLQMEQSALRQILMWGQKNGLIARVPEIKAPKIHSAAGVVRRPAFELHEWQKLYRYMRKWVAEGSEPDEAKKPGPHKLHRKQREMIRRYILFMGTSGLRPNEARQLRWRDIEIFADEKGVEHLLLHISPNTKTGQRECVPLRSARNYLRKLREAAKFTEPDALFCRIL